MGNPRLRPRIEPLGIPEKVSITEFVHTLSKAAYTVGRRVIEIVASNETIVDRDALLIEPEKIQEYRDYPTS